jgi:RNA polymerase sigma factor (sigma-70 family)
MDERPEFAPTRWSLVAKARGATDEGRRALNELCTMWWAPLCAWLRRAGCRDAEDVTQEFCAWLVASGLLDRVAPERGRLRSYLLGCLQNFLRNHQRRESAARRGGNAEHVALDDAIAGAPGTPEEAYDRAWARGLMERALARVAARYAEKEDAARFEALRPFLSTEGGGEYAATAAKLGVSEGAVKGMVHRLRARFRAALEDEVRETLTEPTAAAVAEEIAWLAQVLSVT